MRLIHHSNPTTTDNISGVAAPATVKANPIGIISVLGKLLEQDWEPRRTVLLAFGFDEDTGGVRGAAKIAEELEKTWGRDGITMILDEVVWVLRLWETMSLPGLL